MIYTIVLDFDGTCVTHDFPNIGKEIGAAPVLKKLTDNGHKIILFTMRCDFNGDENLSGSPTGSNEPKKYLTDAINWFKKHKIPLYGIQINPQQKTWTTSPKVWGDIIIDDTALGVPLCFNLKKSNHPFVDWVAVKKYFKTLGLIN